MGKIIETTINRFDGGIVNDPRDTRGNVAQVISNFDILTDRNRLRPYESSEDGDTGSADNDIQNFAIGEKTSADGTYVLYGLGVQAGAADAKIFYKEVTATASNDLGDDGWVAPSGGVQATGNLELDSDLFLYYKKTGKLYGMRSGGQHVWSYDTSADTFTESQKDLGATNNFMTQGIIHSKDDIMYFGVDNVVWKNDNDTFTAALTMPTHLRIRCVAEYGNYLAIACEPTSGATPGFGGSLVYLWNRDDSLTTLTEVIDWGEERIHVIGEVNGSLVGVSVAAGATWFDRRIVFRYLTGTRAVQFHELTSTADVNLVGCGQKHKSRLNFMMGITLNEAHRVGTWSVGGVPGAFTVVQERTMNNDTTFTAGAYALKAFIYVGDYLFQSYSISAVYTMAKTAIGIFTATSVYETKLYTTEGSSQRKDLVGVTIEHEALPASGSPQVVVKYKIDDETTYSTAILTSNTATDVSASAITGLPKDYKEITFRLESTGKAVITGLTFKEEVTGKREYD